jgi:hypothetical protein
MTDHPTSQGPPRHARDPEHWLFRLTGDEWHRAAERERALCLEQLERRSVRAGVTHARRAAGMAWNAVLSQHEDPRYGRSYMEHIHALADDPAIPEAVRAAAHQLRSAPTGPPVLLHLGRPDLSVHAAAGVILAEARARAPAEATDVDAAAEPPPVETS